MEVAGLAALADGENLVLDVAAVDGAAVGEHLEGAGVGGELVVGVVEVGFAALVEGLHGVDLALHLNAVEEGVGAFAGGVVLDAPLGDLSVGLGECGRRLARA